MHTDNTHIDSYKRSEECRRTSRQVLGCKSRTAEPVSNSYVEWNFDGSSTGQAPGDNSDVYIRPVAIFPDPVRLAPNILVMCETWDPSGAPNKFNYRHEAARLMEANKEHVLWFGLEQEYTLLGHDDWPYGWPKGGFPGPQGPYYCAVGTGKVYCRDIVEAHYKACLYAGIKIAGINAEVMPAQWEYQVSLFRDFGFCPPELLLIFAHLGWAM